MERLSKACVSLWSYDALQGLVSRRFSAVGPESLSRVNALLEALVFFDRVVVPDAQLAAHGALIEAIDPGGEGFEILPAAHLRNAGVRPVRPDRQSLAAADRDAEALKGDARAWFPVNEGEDASQLTAAREAFLLLRQWQWSACKEIGAAAEATLLLPLSLRDMERPASRVDELARLLASRPATNGPCEIEFPTAPRFAEHLTAIPPVLAMFAARHRPDAGVGETIRELRDFLTPAREQRRQLEQGLRASADTRDRARAVADFNRAWLPVADLHDAPALLTSDVGGGRFARLRAELPAAGAAEPLALRLRRQAQGGETPQHDRIKAYTRICSNDGALLLGARFLVDLEEKFGVRAYHQARA